MNELIFQQKLAMEFISPKNCKGCRFYVYGKEDQVCLFHSTSIDECNVYQLKLVGKLHAVSNYQVSDKRSSLDELI